MNELRKKYDVIVYGDYKLLDPDDTEVYAYIRKLEGKSILVIANFSANKVIRKYTDLNTNNKLLISNYDDDEEDVLRPYEAKVYYFGK